METRSNHFLIDYENTQVIDFAKLSEPHLRLHLFLGQQQSRLPTDVVQKIHAHASQIELISCPGTGRNALDFLVAFHAGRLSSSDPSAFIHIISRDKGFDPLIKHMKAQSILAARSDSLAEAPLFQLQAKDPKLSNRERLRLATDRLTSMTKSRPRKRKTLITTLASYFKHLGEKEIVALIAQLKKSSFLSIDEKDNVSYPPTQS